MTSPADTPGVPRIESISVHNFRALHDVTFHGLTPMTILLGRNRPINLIL